MTWELALSIGAIFLAIIAVFVAGAAWRRASRRPSVSAFPGLATAQLASAHSATSGDGEPHALDVSRPAFVINPSKNDAEKIKSIATRLCAELGHGEPRWYETTVEDPGAGQARQAIDDGATVVIACGGDGTVREVASTVAGSGVPMGLVPIGTGNLFARNLDIPIDDLRAQVDVALTGDNQPVDVGWLRVTDISGYSLEPAELDSEHIFLVIAGLGFDADMVADTDERLKKHVGWMAYFVAGVRHLHAKKLRATLYVGEGEVTSMKVRTLMVANCGKLPGGLVLMPDARLDDGYLDIAAIDTRGGILGWATLAGKVLLQGLGVRRELPYSIGNISFWRGRTARIRSEEAAQVQVDGDLLGEALAVSTRNDAGALIVRTSR